MADRLDSDSRSILEFRPDIQFIEPEVGPGVLSPKPVGLTLEDVEEEVDRVFKLAKAVNILAAATQARADIRAKDMVIKLDPIVDSSTIAAMRRIYPNDNPEEITFGQYRQCKKDQRLKGESLAEQGLITSKEIDDARKAGGLDNSSKIAGWGTPEASNGGLRPEMNAKLTIIPQINFNEFQDVLIRILINFVWKTFIKDYFTKMPPPMGPAFYALPDEIVPLPPGYGIAELISTGVGVLGEDPPSWMSKGMPEVPTSIFTGDEQQNKEKKQ